jgi:hypothetical protein
MTNIKTKTIHFVFARSKATKQSQRLDGEQRHGLLRFARNDQHGYPNTVNTSTALTPLPSGRTISGLISSSESLSLSW